MLEEAVSETAGGGAQVHGGLFGDGEAEVLEGVFEFAAAAADIAFGGDQDELVLSTDGIAGFTGEAIIDADLSGEDGALGLLAAFAQAALDQRHIHPLHGGL